MAKTYTLKEAAVRCGYKRVNTMREKHLASDEARAALGYHIVRGAIRLDAKAVEHLARELEKEREERGNWRPRNLGPWAKPRRLQNNSFEEGSSRE